MNLKFCSFLHFFANYPHYFFFFSIFPIIFTYTRQRVPKKSVSFQKVSISLSAKKYSYTYYYIYKMKILLVEDNRELGDLVEKALAAERYVVERAADYRTACSKVGDYDYDCILLDLMLPDGNGLDVLRRVKELGKSDSVIIISAKDAIDDKVAGLTLGADDYLAKPFHIAELVARIRSVARRRNAGKLEISFGNVVLHPETHSVEVAGQPLTLSRKEYDIIHYFLMRPGHMIRKESLAEAVWGDHIDQTDDFDFLYAQMKNVRRKLGDAGADVEIKAVYGFGYKLSQKE